MIADPNFTPYKISPASEAGEWCNAGALPTWRSGVSLCSRERFYSLRPVRRGLIVSSPRIRILKTAKPSPAVILLALLRIGIDLIF